MHVSATQSAVKPKRTTVASRLRRSIALAAILSLAAIGASVERGLSKLPDRIVAAFVTFGPAAFYLFGYFYWLPDVLGAPVKRKGSLLHRWSSLARISAVIGSTVWNAWLIALMFDNTFWGSSNDPMPKVILALVAQVFIWPPFLMFACVGASEQYLAQTLSTENSETSADSHGGFTAFVGRIGSCIARWLTKTRALSSGSVLVLATLLLNITLMGECGGDPRKGHEIVTGKAVWVTAAQAGTRYQIFGLVVAELGRWSYILALALAVLFLFACILGPRGKNLRQNRILGVITGCLGLYAICDFIFGWARAFDIVQPLQVVAWAAAWIIPVALWIRRAHHPEHWDHSRIAIMVAVLPIVLLTCAMGVFTALTVADPDALYGFGAYLLGILLLWWGMAQSTVSPRSRPPKSQVSTW